jgi:hypothetical protein
VHEKGSVNIEAAEDDKELEYGKRLCSSSCSKYWFSRNFVREGSLTIVNSNSRNRFQKVSNLSQQRAEASNPLLDDIMINSFLERYKRDFERGMLRTERSKAAQVINWDEVGFDPNGSYRRTFTLGRGGERGWRVTTGEKAPFWATLLYATSANGTICGKPILIHQSSDSTHIAGNLLWGLDEDFLVSTSESGYMDKESLRPCA